jgi:TonB family protein
MQQTELFSGAFLNQQPLFKRLISEFKESSREFRQSPKAYLAAAFRDDGLGANRRKELLRFGMAVGVLVFSTAFFFVVIFPQMFGGAQAGGPQEELVERVRLAADIEEMPEVEAPKADTRAGGGGGGGRQEQTPPSQGRLPEFSLTPNVVTPTTHEPLRPPSLPIQQTVQVDPALQPKFDPNMAIGLPQAPPGPPSDGPGEGGGIGTGKGGGVGSGDGTGVGPGRGYNMGGGDPSLGGGDRNPDGSARNVDQRPRLLNSVRPLYTEEARKNKIQGTVRVRVLVGADGSVKNVRIQTHLPDGLDEQAIAAAYKLRFTPAMRAGQPVAFWQPVEIEFNLR